MEGEEEEEEVRYRLTSDTIVLVLLCRGFSFAKEREGCVVMWVRTSWLVRVADCVSRICGGQGVSWLDGWRSGFGGEGRPSFFGEWMVGLWLRLVPMYGWMRRVRVRGVERRSDAKTICYE